MTGHYFKQLLLPPKCVGCDNILPLREAEDWRQFLCNGCKSDLEKRQKELCLRCEKPVAECDCLTALQKKAKCAGFWKLFYYKKSYLPDPVNKMIYLLKDGSYSSICEFLAGMLAEKLNREKESGVLAGKNLLITYAPRRFWARLESGTDQGEQLARALSEATGIPFEKVIFRGLGRAQKKLSPLARKRNAEKAFRVSKESDLKKRTVILVDDIVTTGASMAACAAKLCKTGAKEVFCVSIASNETNRRFE